MSEMVYVGKEKLVGEVISLDKDMLICMVNQDVALMDHRAHTADKIFLTYSKLHTCMLLQVLFHVLEEARAEGNAIMKQHEDALQNVFEQHRAEGKRQSLPIFSYSS